MYIILAKGINEYQAIIQSLLFLNLKFEKEGKWAFEFEFAREKRFIKYEVVRL